MNDNFKLEIPYIAGLFDSRGSISYRKKVWKMEMSMTDKNVMELIHETLDCGTLKGIKKQWCWQCSHRDTLHVCKLFWPYATVKLHKIEQIIDHYEPDIQELGDNVVELDTYRK
jgi:hypothetical protein